MAGLGKYTRSGIRQSGCVFRPYRDLATHRRNYTEPGRLRGYILQTPQSWRVLTLALPWRSHLGLPGDSLSWRSLSGSLGMGLGV
jgi:hypothetical protein